MQTTIIMLILRVIGCMIEIKREQEKIIYLLFKTGAILGANAYFKRSI